MIKLENLKQGDKIYKICGYHWCQEINITKEKYPFEYQKLLEPTIYTVVGKSEYKNNEYLFYYDEINLFKTKTEATKQMNTYRIEQKGKWSNKDKLISDIFLKCKSCFTDAERNLIKEIMYENKITKN